MSSSMGRIIPSMKWKIKNVWNHRPDIISYYYTILYHPKRASAKQHSIQIQCLAFFSNQSHERLASTALSDGRNTCSKPPPGQPVSIVSLLQMIGCGSNSGIWTYNIDMEPQNIGHSVDRHYQKTIFWWGDSFAMKARFLLTSWKVGRFLAQIHCFLEDLVREETWNSDDNYKPMANKVTHFQTLDIFGCL